jgi:copper transport protein
MPDSRRRHLLRRALLRAVLPALLAVPAILAGAADAQAHAALVVATPTPGSTVPAAPDTVRLTFNEIISVSAGGIALVGPDGTLVQTQARKDPADALSVLVPLPGRLTAGTYAVTWNVVSIDGHPLGGAYRFAVIRASTPLTAPPSTSGTGPSALGAIGRALAAGGALALVGLVGFPWVVVRPVRRRLTGRTPDGIPTEVETLIAGRLPRRAAVCAGIGVLGTAIVLVDTAAGGSGRSVGELLTDPGLLVSSLESRTGALLVARIMLLAAAGGALLVPTRTVPVDASGQAPAAAGPGPQLAAALGFGTAGLLTFSLSSHAAAAATDRWLAISFDALHLLASALWIGGLLGLALVALPVARQLGSRDPAVAGEIAGTLSFGFSVVAQLAMVAVLTTGGYAALVQVSGLDDLGQTSWGTELTAKVALWITVLLIASFNAVAFIPKLADRAAGSTQRLAAAGDLRSAIRLELVLAAGLVVAAALMSATAQPAQVPGRSGGVASSSASNTAAARTTVGTGRAGGYRVEVQVKRSGSGAGTATVFDLGLSSEPPDTGTADPGSGVGILRGPDGVDRAFALTSTTGGRWVSGLLSVSPGSYRLTARFDRSGRAASIPIDLTVPE